MAGEVQGGKEHDRDEGDQPEHLRPAGDAGVSGCVSHGCVLPGRPRLQGAVAAYSGARRSRSALPMTDTLERLIAALAIIGLSSSPKTG